MCICASGDVAVSSLVALSLLVTFTHWTHWLQLMRLLCMSSTLPTSLIELHNVSTNMTTMCDVAVCAPVPFLSMCEDVKSEIRLHNI